MRMTTLFNDDYTARVKRDRYRPNVNVLTHLGRSCLLVVNNTRLDDRTHLIDEPVAGWCRFLLHSRSIRFNQPARCVLKVNKRGKLKNNEPLDERIHHRRLLAIVCLILSVGRWIERAGWQSICELATLTLSKLTRRTVKGTQLKWQKREKSICPRSPTTECWLFKYVCVCKDGETREKKGKNQTEIVSKKPRAAWWWMVSRTPTSFTWCWCAPGQRLTRGPHRQLCNYSRRARKRERKKKKKKK